MGLKEPNLEKRKKIGELELRDNEWERVKLFLDLLEMTHFLAWIKNCNAIKQNQTQDNSRKFLNTCALPLYMNPSHRSSRSMQQFCQLRPGVVLEKKHILVL
jgi:hypothetical protein